MNWIEIVASSILVVLFFALVYDNLRTRFNIQKISRQLIQEKLDCDAIVIKLQEALKENDKKKLEGTEGFVKFLTESRESAFKYIEEVQGSIDKLRSEAAKISFEPQGYFLAEELQDLRKAIADVLKQIPETPKND
jgi:predicted Holliday junction resolvase-like endonuclease